MSDNVSRTRETRNAFVGVRLSAADASALRVRAHALDVPISHLVRCGVRAVLDAQAPNASGGVVRMR